MVVRLETLTTQIAQLEEQRFNIGQFISKEQEEGINNTIPHCTNVINSFKGVNTVWQLQHIKDLVQ